MDFADDADRTSSQGGIIDDRPDKKKKGRPKKRADNQGDGEEFFKDKKGGRVVNKYMNPNIRADVPFYYKRKRIKKNKKDQQTKLFEGDKKEDAGDEGAADGKKYVRKGMVICW